MWGHCVLSCQAHACTSSQRPAAAGVRLAHSSVPATSSHNAHAGFHVLRRLIWRGLELHRMRRVTWQAMASAEEAAAAHGPFNSTLHSMQRMMGIAGDTRQLSVASAGTLLLHAGSVDMADIRSYRMSRATAELTPVRELEGESAPGPGASANSWSGPGPCAEGAEGMMWQYNTAFDNQGQQGAAANNSSLKPIAPGGSATLNNAHRRRTNQGNRTVASSSKGTTRRTGAAADSHGSGAAAAADSSWMNTHVGFDLMQNLGLAGGMGASLALLGAILLHGVLLSVSGWTARLSSSLCTT